MSLTDFSMRNPYAIIALSLVVVRTGLPRITPCKPRSRIRRATLHRATSKPSRCICVVWGVPVHIVETSDTPEGKLTLERSKQLTIESWKRPEKKQP